MNLSKLWIALALATLNGAAYAQPVDTPYSPSETGMAATAAEDAAVSAGAVGGVASETLGGTIATGAAGISALPDTDVDVNATDD